MKKLLLSLLALGLAGTACSQDQNRQGPPEGRQPPKPATILKQMDANGDQQLSKAEVKGPLRNEFANADANNDGFLTLDELKAFKPKRRPPRQQADDVQEAPPAPEND